jgi:Protein of unknown function (DUF2935).
MAVAPYTNRDLNRFWLRQLAECALILYNSLSPDETEIASLAKSYVDRFDALTLRADKATDTELAALNRDAFQTAQDVRKFFIYVLDKVTSQNFHLDLKITGVSSFAAQAESYMDALYAFMNNLKPQLNLIDEEILWLDVFINYCRYLSDNLGNFQKRYKDKAQELAQTLNEYWSFSVELKGIVSQLGGKTIPMTEEHHRAINSALREMYEFISTITKLQRETRIPGSLSIAYLGRIRRVLCFYLINAEKILKATPPDCNPFTNRISNN